MTLAAIAARARPHGLAPLGAFHPAPDDGAPEGCGTLVLLGPDGPDFWPRFRASPEYRDGAPDPLNRWSERVIGGPGHRLRRAAALPLRRPALAPFTAWARRNGEAGSRRSACSCTPAPASSSPSAARSRSPPASPSRRPPRAPATPAPRPASTACPVGALAGGPYDLAACHGYLDTAPGRDCMDRGCAVRRACPVGQGLRPEAQSAFHMAAFHGRQRPCDG